MTTLATVSRTQLQEMLASDEPPIVVEALPPQYYDEGHIPGAIRINKDEVDQLAPTLLPDRDAQIVIYCASPTCQNSTIVARKLSFMGYTNIHEYADGKSDWTDAGLPLEATATA